MYSPVHPSEVGPQAPTHAVASGMGTQGPPPVPEAELVLDDEEEEEDEEDDVIDPPEPLVLEEVAPPDPPIPLELAELPEDAVAEPPELADDAVVEPPELPDDAVAELPEDVVAEPEPPELADPEVPSHPASASPTTIPAHFQVRMERGYASDGLRQRRGSTDGCLLVRGLGRVSAT